jgi:phosphoesterase RecJ-like protein
MAMTVDAILPILKESSKIAVIAHMQPDGDTIGSCLALADSLRAAGKSAALFCQDTPPATLRFLQGLEDFKQQDNSGGGFDLAVAVDCSDRERMGSCSSVFDNSRQTMNIDHHISNTKYAGINYVDPKAAATGEIIYRIAVRLAGQVSRHAAEALYTAVNTDSGSFSFSSTTSDTYRIAADLLDCGINVEKINTCLYKSNRAERIRILARALSTLAFYGNGKIAVMTISREDILAAGADDSDTENIVNYAKDIVGVELGLLLKEVPDGTVKISFRSKDIIDASKLAAQFGGGGHKKAAGASIAADLAESRKQILAAVHTLYKELN